MSSELELFSELKKLTATDGFWEVIACICLRDTFIYSSNENPTKKDFYQNFDNSRLSQTEISTLIGLASQNRTAVKPLTEVELENLLLDTYDLWTSLHSELAEKSIHREAIFYSGNGVYKHQYRDLAKIRYNNDDVWIKENKGFNLFEVSEVFTCIEKTIIENLNIHYRKGQPFLSIFSFSLEDITSKTGFLEEQVKAVLDEFSVVDITEGMEVFNTIDDFNHRNAFPILQMDGKYISFQSYSLWESLYESPFFWFGSDNGYKNIASKNRGAYTENYTASRLKTVFGESNVFTNVDIFDGKNKAGEIDVLVIYGKYVMVIQAKSKKLTIQARKGNIAALNKDFKQAIQDAYDQAWDCCNLLLDSNNVIKTSSGNKLNMPDDIKSLFPICVISDYYPALTMQTRHFLKYEITDKIVYPYVMDVFLIDLITEFLFNPLLVLDYLIKRSKYNEVLISNHELVVLSTYLSHNLYFENSPDLVMLEESLSVNLEIDMLNRRDGVDRLPKVSEGILKYFDKKTPIGSILNDIAFSQDYGLLQLGFLFLSLGSIAVDDINNFINHMCEQFKKDGKGHDGTIPIEEKTGITIHCNNDLDLDAYETLMQHCLLRKYSFQADSWQGICFNPVSNRFRFSIGIESLWEYSEEWEELLKPIRKNEHRVKLGSTKATSYNRPNKGRIKVGRNEACPCGSDKKYKRCCL